MKTLREIRAIIEQFPEAGGVGYVVGPMLLRLAINDPGRISFFGRTIKGGDVMARAFMLWLQCDPRDDTGDMQKVIAAGRGVVFNWEGPPIARAEEAEGVFVVGIKALLETLEALEAE